MSACLIYNVHVSHIKFPCVSYKMSIYLIKPFHVSSYTIFICAHIFPCGLIFPCALLSSPTPYFHVSHIFPCGIIYVHVVSYSMFTWSHIQCSRGLIFNVHVVSYMSIWYPIITNTIFPCFRWHDLPG